MDSNNRSLLRRTARACAVAAVGAALVAPSAAQASGAPPSTTLEGTYTLVHVDGRVGHPGAGSYHQEFLTGGRSYDVKLHHGTSFRSGDTVRLTGQLSDSTMDVSHSSITSFAPDSPAVGGVTQVLVVLAYWTAPDSVTKTSATAVFAQDSSWFSQTSYGQLSLSTTVTPWVHISPPAAGLCSDSSVSNLLTTRAAAAAGYNPSSFDRVVVYFPSSSDSSCTNVAGFAEAPGSRVWLNGSMDLRSTVHEQGHNYGLYHAHSSSCTAPGTSTPAVAPDASAANCTYSDYGDPYDAMGASGLAAEYSASQKNVLGWLGAGREATLTSGGTVNLVPYEQQSTAVHAAAYQASATRQYWFENRSATGPDANLPGGATAGLLVHVDDSAVDRVAGEASSWAPAQTYLLDQSPGSGLSAAVLGYGKSWTSPEGVTFTVGQPSGGIVSITAGGGLPSPPPAAAAAPPPSISTAAAAPEGPLASFLGVTFASGTHTAVVTQGQSVRLSGTAVRSDNRGAVGATVQVQESPHGQGLWRTIGSDPVTGNGFFSVGVRPAATWDLRLQVSPSSGELGSSSNVVVVVVRPVLFAAVSRPTVLAGHVVGLNVSVPGHARQAVKVQRFVHGAWRPYGAVWLGGSAKRSVKVRLLAKGTYLFRFFKPADHLHLGAYSKPLRVAVN